jgi:putative aldouronate transport system permease protein|tara:strand:+ start:1731 stop:2636 length:906 start_codon:yes stop_codon:yes gene_type:complete
MDNNFQSPKNNALALMFLPCAVYYFIFDYIPMGGLMIAFKDYSIQDGILGSPWVGFQHFEMLFGGIEFLMVIKNTLLISIIKIILGFLAPVIFAVLLNEIRIGFLTKGFQSLSLLPYLFSWVILASIFRLIFSNSGPANEIIAWIGVDKPINWLSDDFWFIVVIIFTDIWKGIGIGAIIYMASIAAIPIELYKAAKIDGANRFQQIFYITLPQLKPTMITLLILSMGGFLSAGFDQIYNMYNPLVYDVADIIDTYVLRMLTNLNFEIATAAGMFKSVVAVILIMISNSISKRLTQGEQGLY